jgi:hypothetical protein
MAQGDGNARNKAIDFSSTGKTHIQTPYKNGMLLNNAFTFQSWIMIRDDNNTSTIQSLMDAAGKYAVEIDGSTIYLSVYKGDNVSLNCTEYAFTGASFVRKKYQHISISYHASGTTGTAILYIDGVAVDTVVNTIAIVNFPTVTAADSLIYFGRYWEDSNYLNGYMDELRLWNRVLSAEEITQNYNAYISGKESGLKYYYRFDELNELGEVYDMSGTNNNFNMNHGKISGAVQRTDVESAIPTPDQLSIKAITDANGNYLINTIPYTGDGNIYNIIPLFGVHQFDPNTRPLFFSSNSAMHNNIDFSDISSFKVSGKVIYDGGTYPVEGCQFKVDGRVLITANGEVISSDADGKFTIDVPIGVHEVRVEKRGHTFVNDGLILQNGSNVNYNDDISEIVLRDLTRVKVIGHLVGGKLEDEKSSGFGERVNNIGADALTLTAAKPQYLLRTDNNITAAVSDTLFVHNNGEWQKNAGRIQDTTTMRVNGNTVTIHVSPVTGEYVAWLYPERYTIENIYVNGDINNIIYDRRESLDLTDSPVSDPQMLLTSVRTWTDSTLIDRQGNVEQHYQKEDKTDTVKFHKEWGYYYQAIPSFSIQQIDGTAPLNYFGDESRILPDNDTVYFYNGGYLFDKPVFTQGESYIFFLRAFEKYENTLPTSPLSGPDTPPVAGGKVSISSGIAVDEYPETIVLDDKGEGVYEFIGGDPDLTTGMKTFSARVIIADVSYLPTNPVNGIIEAYVLGGLSTGTDFMTAASDKVDFVLHDPPGSESSAYIEKGSTITSTEKHEISNGLKQDATLNVLLGTDQYVLAGIGLLSGGETEVVHKVGVQEEITSKWTNGNTVKNTFAFTDKVTTSGSNDFVGHAGDVFVGSGNNILYGLTNSLTVKKADKFDVSDTITSGGDYALGLTVDFSFGATFATRFYYTETEIENIMIPKWRAAKENVFIFNPSPAQIDPAIITEPVYVSKLAKDHPDFAKPNNHPDFGSGTTTSDENSISGTSYTIYFPTGFLTKWKIGMSISNAISRIANPLADPEILEFTDTVSYYHNKIESWERLLADNEKAKVDATYDNNYSFGGGVVIEKSEKKSSSESHEHKQTIEASLLAGGETGFNIFGVGLEVQAHMGWVRDEEHSTETETETESTIGFELKETGTKDELTVDYGIDPTGGTFVFKTRGGRTSCPYEGEVKTKYYEPDKHILGEGTMRIEVPHIAITGGESRVQVPASRAASFNLSLTNASETGDEGIFRLTVDEKTNPDGAVLSIDGIGIGNGRLFTVPSGIELVKNLTVQKGPNADKYENILLRFSSECDGDIYDSVRISVEFIPSCTDVNVRAPLNNWTANTVTGDTLVIDLAGYDVNYDNFDHIDLQYRPLGAPQWNTLTAFFAADARYNATNITLKEMMASGASKYYWNLASGEVMDGQYEIRARAVCATVGGTPVLSETESEPVAGVKDMVRPTVFGKAQPADGILSGTNDIMIQFNEDINEGMVTGNNFTIRGIQNGSITDHSISIHFNGMSDYMATEQEINLSDKPFTIEFWVKRNAIGASGAGTIFSHGSGDSTFTIGFDVENKLQVTIGKRTFTGLNAITDIVQWGYYAVIYDGANLTAYYAVSASTSNEIPTTAAGTYSGEGPVYAGSNNKQTSFASVDMHGLKIWSKALQYGTLSSNMYNILSGNEIGLIAYWSMNEGKGTLVQEKARNKHGALSGTWRILPESKALQFDGNDYLDINTASNVVIDKESDFSAELWFNTTNGNGTLLANGRGDGQDYDSKKLSIYLENGNIKVASNGIVHSAGTGSYSDNKWHHFVLSVSRTGAANIFIDGNIVYFTEGNLFDGLAGSSMSIGSRTWKKRVGETYTVERDNYYSGIIDEVRIWNMALTQEFINTYGNLRINGNEKGLVAYYPFDQYNNEGNLKTLVFSLNDQTVASSGITPAPSPTLNGATESTETAPIKDAGPIMDYAFNFVTNKDKIILNLTDKADRIENTQIFITANGIQDLYGNLMGAAHTWHAYIDRAFLKWEDNTLVKTKKNNEPLSFTTKIINTGGANEPFTIENIPSWLTINPANGTVAPNSSKEISFTVNDGINPGNYEEVLNLHGAYSNLMMLKLNVGGNKPDWSVNPRDYESSMSVIGQLKVNNIISTDENDIIGAFIDGVCVGVASPQYIAAFDRWHVSLSIYYSSENSLIEFRIWDASTGKTYAQVSPVDIAYQSNTVQGAIQTPVIFETTNFLLTSIDVGTGWNWVSFNVASIALDNANLLLQGINNGEEIKGQGSSEFSRYDVAAKYWSNNGKLNGTNFNNLSMYMIKMSGNNTIALTGEVIDPKTTTLSLAANWNWISYLPQVNMTVDEAFAGLNPTAGDIVKNQVAFAVYDAQAGWVGNLDYMRPGLGYMYKAAQAATFKYPERTTLTRSGSQALTPSNGYSRDDVPASLNDDIAPDYESNLSMIAKVVIASNDISETARLVAKVGNERRGVSEVKYVGDKKLFFLPVYSNYGDETVTFVLENNGKEIPLRETITYRSNAVLGTLDEPVVLTDVNINLVVYPNPFGESMTVAFDLEENANVRVELISMKGAVIHSEIHALAPGHHEFGISGAVIGNLSEGLHLVRVVLNNKEQFTNIVIKNKY